VLLLLVPHEAVSRYGTPRTKRRFRESRASGSALVLVDDAAEMSRQQMDPTTFSQSQRPRRAMEVVDEQPDRSLRTAERGRRPSS
jgi:hypothetical protein